MLVLVMLLTRLLLWRHGEHCLRRWRRGSLLLLHVDAGRLARMSLWRRLLLLLRVGACPGGRRLSGLVCLLLLLLLLDKKRTMHGLRIPEKLRR